MLNKKVIILRGLPGTGKSTMAQKVFVPKGFVHCEADQYFTKFGEYKFIPSEIALAHEYCTDKAVKAMAAGKRVVIANTFTRIWEIKEVLDRLPIDPVRDIAVVTVVGGTGSIHNIDERTMEKMKQRWQLCRGESIMTLDTHIKNRAIRYRGVK